MTDKKTREYEIDGIKYFIPQLCTAQEQEVIGLFGKVGMLDVIAGIMTGSLDTEISIDSILVNLSEKKLLQRFYATVLVPVNDHFREEKIPDLEEIFKLKTNLEMGVDIFQDFFTANRRSIEKLNAIFRKLNHQDLLKKAGKKSRPANG